MTLFLLSAAGLTTLALAFVLPGLLRPATPTLGRGHDTQPQPQTHPRLALGLGLAVPVLAIALYAALGNPKGLSAVASALPAPSPDAAAQAQATTTQIEGMVARLASRLQANPDDLAGWRMLAKSYESLGRFDQAVQAYAALDKLQPDDPEVLTDYAVALGMKNGRSLSGEPEKLIRRALDIDPHHVQALALLGAAAFDRKDYAQAVAPWKKILTLVPPDSDVARSIAENVGKAQALAQQAGAGKQP
jgi:cytochrome c-type biogenesis protein CcmH